ncbi:hypothetical protein GCM10007979_27780 [Nocardioides albus]|nr:hypothetical protein GCM10007979_27780 [Nocardioides albus]
MTVPEGCIDAVVDYYRDQRILEVSGAASGCLLVDDRRPGEVTVVAWWHNEGDYARWEKAPEREAFAERIAAMTNGEVRATNRELRVVHRMFEMK